MPIYEYECDGCRCRFERRQSVWDEPVRTCPECEGAVRRLIQPVGLVFKGSGFYITDNRPKSGDDGGGEKTVASDNRAKSGDDGGAKTSSGDSGDKKVTEVASAKKD